MNNDIPLILVNMYKNKTQIVFRKSKDLGCIRNTRHVSSDTLSVLTGTEIITREHIFYLKIVSHPPICHIRGHDKIPINLFCTIYTRLQSNMSCAATQNWLLCLALSLLLYVYRIHLMYAIKLIVLSIFIGFKPAYWFLTKPLTSMKM